MLAAYRVMHQSRRGPLRLGYRSSALIGRYQEHMAFIALAHIRHYDHHDGTLNVFFEVYLLPPAFLLTLPI
jgi:hypothetical protein